MLIRKIHRIIINININNIMRMRIARGILLSCWDMASADVITVNCGCYRPVGPSLDGLVVIAWILRRQDATLKLKWPSDAIWQHFENHTLTNARNKPEQKPSSCREVNAINILPYLGYRLISSEYGHKVITRLSIKEGYQKSANEWLESHIKGDWVAVHYRGTDIRAGKKIRYKSRYRIDLKPYVTYLKEVLDSQCSIFACSDQAQFIDEMKAAFPGRVFARDIKRSYDNNPLHLDFIRFAHCDSQKRDAMYEQERDALIDVLVLSKAGLIYTTGSAFVDVVRYFNPEAKIVSLDGRTIGKGKNNMPIPERDLLKRLSLL